MLATFAAAAQAGPPPVDRQPANRDSVLGAALARLRPGKTIRIHLIGNGRVEGEFASGSTTTLTLAGTPAPVQQPIAALDSLWVREPGTKKGALIGTISGGIAGAAFGIFINGVACEPDGDPCPEAIPIVGLGGAASGALLGALIGSQFSHWRLRAP